MWSRYRAGSARFLYDATIWCSIAFGILPFRYNAKLQKITPSKWCRLYSVCIHVFIVIAIFLAWPRQDPLDFDLMKRNEPMETLTRVIILLNIYTLIVIITRNWREYKSVLEIFKEFAAIERIYYDKHIVLAQKCVTFDNYIILKALAMLLQNLSFALVIFATSQELDIYTVMVICFGLVLGNLVFLVVLHFYNFVLTTYRYIWILQCRLLNIANHEVTNAYSYVVTNEIYEIAGVYMRLLKVTKRFGQVYGQQLLCSIAVIMCANIQTLYLLRILWSERAIELSAWDVFSTLQAVLVNIFYFWLTITVCELALGVARDLPQLLKCFSNYEQLDAELERSLEILAALCRNNAPEFRLCGFVDLNHLTGLKTLLTMILYLIYLVQFSYNDF